MGSDDLHKKRKEANKTNKYRRKDSTKTVRKRTLIACEDSKATPDYLKQITKEYRLSNTDVRICGKECGSAPSSILDFAKDEIKQSWKNKEGFEQAFLVFDRDTHESYDDVIAQVRQHPIIRIKRQETKLFCFPSVICFEYWVLLHFIYTAKPFHNYEALRTELKPYISDYEKGNMAEIYQTHLKDLTDTAAKHATHIANEAKALGEEYTHNPVTYMHELLAQLDNLRHFRPIM